MGMHQYVEVTNFSELHWMLGIEVQCDRNVGMVHLPQHAYIDSILQQYHLDNLKPLSIPWTPRSNSPQSSH